MKTSLRHLRMEISSSPPLDPRPAASSIIIEETIVVNISVTETPRITYIETSLPSEQAGLLIDGLHENIDRFAWSYQDMPGLDLELVMHHLAVDPSVKPVK